MSQCMSNLFVLVYDFSSTENETSLWCRFYRFYRFYRRSNTIRKVTEFYKLNYKFLDLYILLILNELQRNSFNYNLYYLFIQFPLQTTVPLLLSKSAFSRFPINFCCVSNYKFGHGSSDVFKTYSTVATTNSFAQNTRGIKQRQLISSFCSNSCFQSCTFVIYL